MPAVIYQSSQTNTGTTSVVVTKPTSLAVGDVMIAQVAGGSGNGSSTPTITAPSGWTVELSQTRPGLRFEVYSKTATSSDVAASNFTWTSALSIGMVGAISRFTNPNTDPVDQIQSNNGGGTAYAVPTGITPTKAAGTMLIHTFAFASGARTSSGYSIATDNPTWSEAYDFNVGVSTDFLQISMAYSHRPSLTATGNVSVTPSSSIEDNCVSILNLPAQELTFATVTTSPYTPTIRTVIDQIATVTTSLLAPTVTEIENIWSNVSKNVSSWVNQTKT